MVQKHPIISLNIFIYLFTELSNSFQKYLNCNFNPNIHLKKTQTDNLKFNWKVHNKQKDNICQMTTQLTIWSQQ